MLKEQAVSYIVHVVQRGPYHMYGAPVCREEPAIVLMHGFPDNLHLLTTVSFPGSSPPAGL